MYPSHQVDPQQKPQEEINDNIH